MKSLKKMLVLAVVVGLLAAGTASAARIGTAVSGVDALFSLADLDQKPRVLYQPGPLLSRDLRRKAPGTVQIIFIVDQQGRVENPAIQASSDPIFEKAALAAVKQWKFEPGKRNGQPLWPAGIRLSVGR